MLQDHSSYAKGTGRKCLNWLLRATRGMAMTGKRFRAALDELEISPDDFAER
jgi:hypothetical protein